MKWTDKQLLVVLKAAGTADSGCSYCVKECLFEFIHENNYDYNLLDRMEMIYKAYDLRCCGYETDWEDITPYNALKEHQEDK